MEGASEDQLSEKTTIGDICLTCKRKFIRIRSHKCKVTDVSKNVDDKLESSTEKNSSHEKCIGCKKEFKRISRHLASAIKCQKYYNYDEMKENSSSRKRKSRQSVKHEREKKSKHLYRTQSA